MWSYFEATISGEYRFAVSCDDFCTLSLGDDKDSAKEIIKFQTWVPEYSWKRYDGKFVFYSLYTTYCLEYGITMVSKRVHILTFNTSFFFNFVCFVFS